MLFLSQISSAQPPLFPVFKKFAQCRRVRFVRAELNGVHTRRAKLPREVVALFFLPQRKGIAAAGVARVEFHNFTRLGVFQGQTAKCRQFKFVAVRDLHGNDIVLAIRNPERGLSQTAAALNFCLLKFSEPGREFVAAASWDNSRSGFIKKSEITTAMARCGKTR